MREQIAVAVVGSAQAVLEPQTESEVVSERDQNPVHEQLRNRMAVDGEGRGSDPPAHAAVILMRNAVSAALRAR